MRLVAPVCRNRVDGAVRDALGVHGVDEAEVVDVSADVGEELADPAARSRRGCLKSQSGGEDGLRSRFCPTVRGADADVELDFLAESVASDVLGFGVEGVHVARAARP